MPGRLWQRLDGNREHPGISVAVKVDETGVGGGVIDRLEETRLTDKTLKYSITPVNFGGKGGELEEEPIPFANNTGLLWGRVKHLLATDRLGLIKTRFCYHSLIIVSIG